MIRSFLLLVAVMVAATPVNAARKRSRNIVYRPVTSTMSNVTTRTATSSTNASSTNTSSTNATSTNATPTNATPTTTSSTIASSTNATPANATPTTTETVKYERSSLQVWADTEAQMMVARRFKGHVRSAPMGTFVGVGFSMSGNVVTCVGSGQLVAQATLRGPDGYYHVRVWR